MQNYIVQTNNDIHYVVETKTSQVIKCSNNLDEITKLSSNLNAGSGFNGNTPAFLTQRTDGFKGGIQLGLNATDTQAKTLDRLLRENRDEIFLELKKHGYQLQKKLHKDFLNAHGIFVGFHPDGGIWFKDGKCVGIFEGKKQGINGNAYERWCKNYMVSCHIWTPEARYITFATGKGFENDHCPIRFAQTALNFEKSNKELNTIYSKGQSWLVNPIGFDKEAVKAMMIKIITE